MKNILKLTLCTLFMMMHGNYMMATKTAPTPSANTTATKQTLQSAAGTGQYYCTFVNASQVPIILSFANGATANLPVKGSYPMNVTGWASLRTIATDQTGANQPSSEKCIGNFGYNTRAVVKIEKVTKTENCPLPVPGQMPKPCTTSYSKTTIPTLSIVLDDAPKGYHKPTGSKIAKFKNSTASYGS